MRSNSFRRTVALITMFAILFFGAVPGAFSVTETAYAAQNEWKFDFGSGALQEGYVRVDSSSAYSSELAYGFADISKVSWGDRSTADALRTDYAAPGDTSFNVDLPYGDYSITVVSGDSQEAAHVGMVVEMIQKVATTAVASGSFMERSFTLSMVDGQMNMFFTGTAPKINSLIITKLPERTANTVPNVFLAADSTVSSYGASAKPQAGWGQMISRFFTSDVNFVNRAIGGRSSKSFIVEGRLDSLLQELRPGDYMFVQFGHNDASIDNEARYASVPDYKNYLKLYINGARQRGATPILVTTVTMRYFDQEGKAIPSFVDYVNATKEVAVEMNAPLVDLSALSVAYLNLIGPETSKLVYLHVPAAIYSAFPDGLIDNVHFQEFGAIQIARLVAGAVKQLDIPLAGLVTDVTIPPVPSVPQNVAVSNLSNTGAKISWNASEGTEIYKIYRKLASDTDYVSLMTTSDTSINISGMVEGKKYDVRVSAISGSGESEKSAVVTFETSVAGLNFDFGLAGSPVAAGYTEVNLSTLYTKERGYGITDSTDMIGRDRGERPTLSTILSDAVRDWLGYFNVGWEFKVDLPNGLYAVKLYVGDYSGTARTNVAIEGVSYGAFNAAASSHIEREIPLVTLADGQMVFNFTGSTAIVNALEIKKLLMTPTNVTIDGSSLAWAKVENAVNYKIYRSANGGVSEWLGSSETNSYPVTAVEPDVNYVYTVTAINSNNQETPPSEAAIELSLVEEKAALSGPAEVFAGQAFDLTYSLRKVTTEVLAQEVTFSFDSEKLEFVSAESLNNEKYAVIVDTKESVGEAHLLIVYLDRAQSNPNEDLLTLKFRARAAAGDAKIDVSQLITADSNGVETSQLGTSYTLRINVVDKAALNALITAVKAIHQAAVVGTDAGQYSSSSKAQLQQAITAAQQVSEDITATDQQVASAAALLDAARQVFLDSVVRLTGDYNNDQRVSIGDLAIVASHYGTRLGDSEWELVKSADVNGDNVIDIVDLSALARLVITSNP
ncbi:GDSL-type esterase/lipase family protein [Paenibacillus sp. FSL H8-0548]|uniref:fibronectin type III domain-containing protein n=1 Tax=Paenibacillus sp. FSL H8-0548 TaxID=1920422 RepID=UPI0015C407B5|nr:GDSL-type esterase/lipase family protein [Paenibacillus sp. FSL H8-0548]